MPVKLYCGNDEYSLNQELQKTRQSLLQKDFADLNRKVLIEKLPKQIELREIVEQIETTPMIFGNLVVEIHATSLFTRGKTDNDAWLTRLINNLKDVPDNVFVIFVCLFPKDTDKKIDSAKKLVKIIKEVGEIKEFNAFKFYETNKIIEWILKTAKSKKLILSNQNATIFQSFVGTDLRTLDSELEKLKTYILPNNEIMLDDILKLAQTNEDAFKILDFWLKNDKIQTLQELQKLMQKDAPQKIIALLQTTIKRWLRIKLEAQYSDANEIAKIIGAHPFFVQNELAKLKNTDSQKLIDFRKNLNKAEFQMKSGEIKPELALEMVLMQ